MSEEYDEIWKTIRASLNMTANEFVPKLYETLTKQDGYSPKDARDKIKRDATNIWKAETIDRHIPEEAKQQIKVAAGKQRGQQQQNIEDVVEDLRGNEEDIEDTNKELVSAGLNRAEEQTFQESPNLKKLREEKGTLVEEQPEMIIDPILLDEKIKEIAKLQEEKQALENTLQDLKKEKVESAMSKSFTTERELEFSDQDLTDIAKKGGIAPFILTAYPEQKTQTIKLDRIRLHEKKKR